MQKLRVVISVRGGVAYVEEAPRGVEVEIIDYDNLEDTGQIEEDSVSLEEGK